MIQDYSTTQFEHCAWTHFLAFMEWADDIGSGLAAWSYVPVQSSSFSLSVFYRTLVVERTKIKPYLQ